MKQKTLRIIALLVLLLMVTMGLAACAIPQSERGTYVREGYSNCYLILNANSIECQNAYVSSVVVKGVSYSDAYFFGTINSSELTVDQSNGSPYPFNGQATGTAESGGRPLGTTTVVFYGTLNTTTHTVRAFNVNYKKV